MINVISMAALVIFIYMSAFFLLALAKKNNGIVDIAWAWASSWSLRDFRAARGRPAPAMAGLGHVDLGRMPAWHIFRRSRGREEDFRYAAWRASGADTRHQELRADLHAAGLLLLLVISPFCWSSAAQPPLRLLGRAGVLVWLTGFLFETIGDRQLAAFIKDPANRGRIMTAAVGLHPPPQLFRRSRPVWGMASWPFLRPGAGWD